MKRRSKSNNKTKEKKSIKIVDDQNIEKEIGKDSSSSSSSIYILCIIFIIINILGFSYFNYKPSLLSKENTCGVDFDNINGICIPSAKGKTESAVPKSANAQGKPREANRDCQDRYPKECPIYVRNGECNKNPGWMIINCPRGCQACHLRDPKLRCARESLNMTIEPVYKPGDMNYMFSTIKEKFGK
jgi:hypothetical protein